MALVREVTDERDALLTFLATQRDGVTNAIEGLTEEQARSRSTASELSLASLLKHLTAVERRWSVVGIAGREDPDLWPVKDWNAEFQLTAEDTVAHLVTEYQKVARQTEETVAAVPDLNATAGQDGFRSIRWVLMHLIEETARHAGHADILREAIDGATAPDLAKRPT